MSLSANTRGWNFVLFVLCICAIGFGVILENRHKHENDVQSGLSAKYEQVIKHAYTQMSGDSPQPSVADKQTFLNYLNLKGISISDAQAVIIEPQKVNDTFMFNVSLSGYSKQTKDGVEAVPAQLLGTFDRQMIEGYFYGRGAGGTIKDEDLK